MTSYKWSLLWLFRSNPPLKQQRHSSTDAAGHCAHLMYGFTNLTLHDSQCANAIITGTLQFIHKYCTLHTNNNIWAKRSIGIITVRCNA